MSSTEDAPERVTVSERNAHRREARKFLPVLASRRRPSAQLVLAILVDQLDRTLRVTVSAEALIEYTGLHRSTLFEALEYLEAEGFLERVRGRTKNTYRVRVENLETILESHRPRDGDSLHRPRGRDGRFEKSTVPTAERSPSPRRGREGSAREDLLPEHSLNGEAREPARAALDTTSSEEPVTSGDEPLTPPVVPPSPGEQLADLGRKLEDAETAEDWDRVEALSKRISDLVFTTPEPVI